MSGRMRLAGGYGLAAEPPPMLTARLTAGEVLALAGLIERQSAEAEIAGDVERADRLAGRAADLRLQSRKPMPVRRIPRAKAAPQRAVATIWAGAPA